MRKTFLKAAIVILSGIVLSASSVFAADGFGRAATGGAGGKAVTVTNAAQLTTYATAAAPYIITVSGTITLSDNLHITSNKTIQGANTHALINGDFYLKPGVNNVIIQKLNFTNPSGVGDKDGISVKGATNVFITKCSFNNCKDGECDITEKSDFVTVSYCSFTYTTQSAHDFCMLIGASDSMPGDAGKLHVTVHHCWFNTHCYERMPSVRYGRVHVYNNYYSCPGNLYCIRSRISAQVLVENSYFDHVNVPMTIYVTTGVKGLLRAVGNILDHCTLSGPSDTEAPGTDHVFAPPYSYTLQTAAAAKLSVMASAGNR